MNGGYTGVMRVPVRVAYDISFLGLCFENPSGQSGVYRTVEELLRELCRRSDIELTAVAASGDNPLVDVTNSSRYVARHDKLACRFDPALTGRLGLSNLYRRSCSGGSTPRAGASPGSSIGPRISRKASRILSRVVTKLDRTRVSFGPGRYDLFHSPFLKLPPHAVIGGIPRMLTVYDLIFLKNAEFMTTALVTFLKAIFASVDVETDWVACISEFTKHEFCEFTGMSPERVFVTPLAAADHFRPVRDPDQISAVQRKYGIPAGACFLTLSALQPRKNFSHLIRCFVRLLSDHPGLDVNLVIVGAPGWLYEEIFTAGRMSGDLRNRIVFTGFVANEDLSAVYSGAAAFLFPSLYEGFGLPPLEAMQCGVPVIVSNTTALPEVVGDAALLVDPTDADALCQAMLDVLTNAELSHELSVKGLLRSKRFSWAACAQKTADAYTIVAGVA